MMIPPRAYTFIGLNGLRTLSIIGLLLVFSSNVVTLFHDVQAVNRFHTGEAAPDSATNATTADILNSDYITGSTVPNQPAGVFWAVLNRLLIITQVIVLLLSEIGWPAAFFNRFFPVLGDDFGLGALGIIECLLGAAILSHHVDLFSLVAAFFLFAIGCINMLAGLIFRQSAKTKRSITAWREHAKSALPTHIAGVDISPVVAAGPSLVSSVFKQDKATRAEDPGHGFGPEGEREAGRKGFRLSRPVASLLRH
ncbi:hypothetical protein B0H15DRAFT_921179 [Mycena belliarum]|uniref:DUF7598 domain-containing protein n=1 Tax=Mycena belliarum TaxID=1033014 RepID=A0AAD6UEY0_9AGAR|nr:hypothetical protein B0H15DRAFT_921179 [Mycena belliae]